MYNEVVCSAENQHKTNKYIANKMVGKVIILDLYFVSMNQQRNIDNTIPLNTPGFSIPGKNGVAKEETTLIIGIVNINKNKESYVFNFVIILAISYNFQFLISKLFSLK